MTNEVSTTQLQSREEILALEKALVKLPQYLGDLTHHFAPGLYGREVFMAAGATLVGKLHKHKHLNILLEGKLAVRTEFGHDILEAPLVFVSEPGTKRAGHIIEDTRWITFHPTQSTDLDEIEAEVIAPTYDNLLEAI